MTVGLLKIISLNVHLKNLPEMTVLKVEYTKNKSHQINDDAHNLEDYSIIKWLLFKNAYLLWITYEKCDTQKAFHFMWNLGAIC